MSRIRRWAWAGLCTVALGGAAHVSTAASVANGGFETGALGGWTVYNQSGGNGNWFVYQGTLSPLSGFRIPAPPEGVYGAASDQLGPGSHILYQDFQLEPGYHHTLSFVVYYSNFGLGFASPPTLDYSVFPNQQYRIDVLDPAAPLVSVTPGEVLATVFQTASGAAVELPPTPMSVDLSNFAGRRVRIRFAEVDNQGFFIASVDDVVMTSTLAFPTSTEQCKWGHWRDFGSAFTNQGDCVAYVATHGKNEPGKNLPRYR